jgi:hypothetical protein
LEPWKHTTCGMSRICLNVVDAMPANILSHPDVPHRRYRLFGFGTFGGDGRKDCPCDRGCWRCFAIDDASWDDLACGAPEGVSLSTRTSWSAVFSPLPPADRGRFFIPGGQPAAAPMLAGSRLSDGLRCPSALTVIGQLSRYSTLLPGTE